MNLNETDIAFFSTVLKFNLQCRKKNVGHSSKNLKLKILNGYVIYCTKNVYLCISVYWVYSVTAGKINGMYEVKYFVRVGLSVYGFI